MRHAILTVALGVSVVATAGAPQSATPCCGITGIETGKRSRCAHGCDGTGRERLRLTLKFRRVCCGSPISRPPVLAPVPVGTSTSRSILCATSTDRPHPSAFASNFPGLLPPATTTSN